MRRNYKQPLWIAASMAALATVVAAQDAWDPIHNMGKTKRTPPATREYISTIHKTAQMVGDQQAQQLAQRHGLNILNVTWEDTGRYKGSAVGPNISDMTIQVGAQDPQTRQFSVTCMPVIRHPNFSDVSCDIDPHEFTLLVGNHKGRPLKRVSLYEFLAEPTNYLSKPNSWLGRNKSLLAG